jgi:Fur family ferric uptake transcriptional regulator
VAAVVRNEIGAISLQSVYDTLSLLVSEGLLRRIQPAGSPARFEDRVGDNHHHLICRTCGRVVDVDCAVGAAPCLTAHADGGYEIDEAEVAFWGRCPDCIEQAGSPSPNPDASPARRDHGRNSRPASATATPTVRGRTPRNNDRRGRRSQ